MEMTTINPVTGIYPTGADYAHGMQIRNPQRILYVSGTMGLDHSGRAAATLEQQLELIWANIGRILSEAAMDMENVARVTSYLTDRTFVEPNQQARVEALGGRAVPTTAIVVKTLEDDWLVEIEVIAVA